MSIQRKDDNPLALAAVHISKSFPSATGRIVALDGVTVELPQGSWVTIIGPSGCGKTTFLRIMAGLLHPDAGQVITSSGGNPRGQVAYMPQADTLLPWRNALDNAILASQVARRPLEQARSEARELFSRFGLAGFERFYPAELSGGMRQRLTLIRTFLAHREVLLLDEPLGSLDALTRASLQEWLLSVWEELGKTILFVTHDVEEALFLSDRVILLSERPGKVRAEFKLTVPRPRSRIDQQLAVLKGKILHLLHVGTSNA